MAVTHRGPVRQFGGALAAIAIIAAITACQVDNPTSVPMTPDTRATFAMAGLSFPVSTLSRSGTPLRTLPA